MALTGRLPPAFIIKASIAKSVDGNSSCSNVSAENDSIHNGEHELLNIERTIKSLRIKKTSCGVLVLRVLPMVINSYYVRDVKVWHIAVLIIKSWIGRVEDTNSNAA